MDTMKLTRNQRRGSRRSRAGFSMIEVMFGVGVLAVVSLGIGTVMRQGFIGQKSITSIDDVRLITTDVASLLTNGEACLNTFGTLVPNATTGPTAAGVEVAIVKDKDANPAYQANTLYGNRTIKFLRILLGGTNPRILGFSNMAAGVRTFAYGPKGMALRTLGLPE